MLHTCCYDMTHEIRYDLFRVTYTAGDATISWIRYLLIVTCLLLHDMIVVIPWQRILNILVMPYILRT